MVSRGGDSPRRYDGSRRRADAESRHRRIVDEAAKLFVDKGFGATSIGDIAAAAGVSAPTIYATFGSKAGVLARAIDVALVGDFDEVPAFDRAPRLRTAGDFGAYADFVTAINVRVAPLVRVMEQAAATDAGLAELRTTLIERIRTDCRRWIDQLDAPLRPGMSPADAADIFAVAESPYIYSYFTVDAGWSPERYRRWIADALPTLLLAPEGGAP